MPPEVACFRWNSKHGTLFFVHLSPMTYLHDEPDIG